eukprot:XP_011677317.1 PREDICTED: tankyrase-2-like [Strongylocentrotus purpuratus]
MSQWTVSGLLPHGQPSPGRSPPGKVARAGQLAELQQLLNEMDPADRADSVSEHDTKNYSALHYAAGIDNLCMVKLLVQHGADVDDVGEADLRPLHLAAGAKKDPAKVESAKRISRLPDGGVVIFLLSKNADVNAEDSRGRTPLHIATLQGNTEAVVQILSKSDTELNKADKRNTTPLLLACLYGKIDIAILLINKGADLTVYDDNYDTTLHIAFSEGNKKIARKIIEKAKETAPWPHVYDEIAEFVLDAAKKGHTETVAALIRWKRSDVVNTCDDMGNAPLHYASEAGHDLTVQELIKALADSLRQQEEDQQQMQRGKARAKQAGKSLFASARRRPTADAERQGQSEAGRKKSYEKAKINVGAVKWLSEDRRQQLGHYSSLLTRKLPAGNVNAFQNYLRMPPDLFDEIIEE